MNTKELIELCVYHEAERWRIFHRLIRNFDIHDPRLRRIYVLLEDMQHSLRYEDGKNYQHMLTELNDIIGEKNAENKQRN